MRADSVIIVSIIITSAHEQDSHGPHKSSYRQRGALHNEGVRTERDFALSRIENIKTRLGNARLWGGKCLCLHGCTPHTTLTVEILRWVRVQSGFFCHYESFTLSCVAHLKRELMGIAPFLMDMAVK